MFLNISILKGVFKKFPNKFSNENLHCPESVTGFQGPCSKMLWVCLWVSLSAHFHSHTMNSIGHFYLMYGDLHSKRCKVNDNYIWWKVTVVQIFSSQPKSWPVSWSSGMFFSQMRVIVLLYTCPLADNHSTKENESLELRMTFDKDLVILSFVTGLA